MTVHVAYKLFQSLLGVEHLRLAKVAFLVGAQVGQRNGDASIQVGQLAHTTGNDVIFKFGGSEDAAIGPELLARTCFVGIAYNLHVVQGLSLFILLLVDVTVAVYLRQHMR